MPQYIPLKIDELKKRRQDYLKTLKTDTKDVSKLDKLALWITEHVGSMRFFLIIFLWTTFWLGWNLLAPKTLRFDPTRHSFFGYLFLT